MSQTPGKKHIVFDFDGTLVDTIDLGVDIYNRIAPQYRCKTVTAEEWAHLRTVKPQLFLKEYGITPLKMLLLILRMRRELARRIPDIDPIDGIRQALQGLKDAGFNLGILTSNSAANVKLFLEHHNLTPLIDFIYSGRKLFRKDLVMAKMLRDEHLSRENVVYVGDETRDIEASKKSGIPMVAVCWGMNDAETLSGLDPEGLVSKPDELLGCIRNLLPQT